MAEHEPRRSAHRGFLLAALVAAGLLQAPAASGGSPPPRAAMIIARALSYERTLDERVGSALVVGVVYKAGNTSSEASAAAWTADFAKLASAKVRGKTLTSVKLAYDVSRLQRAADADGVDVFLACEGLDAELDSIAAVAQSRRVLTVGELARYVEKKLSLGVVLTDGKHEILINLSATEREQIRFSSQLLKLARVVR